MNDDGEWMEEMGLRLEKYFETGGWCELDWEMVGKKWERLGGEMEWWWWREDDGKRCSDDATRRLWWWLMQRWCNEKTVMMSVSADATRRTVMMSVSADATRRTVMMADAMVMTVMMADAMVMTVMMADAMVMTALAIAIVPNDEKDCVDGWTPLMNAIDEKDCVDATVGLYCTCSSQWIDDHPIHPFWSISEHSHSNIKNIFPT
jgi:hypothetical protein